MTKRQSASTIVKLAALVTGGLFWALVATGIVPLMITGGPLSGVLLLVHVGLGGAFALSLAALAVFRIESHGFETPCVGGQCTLAERIVFWLVVFFGLCLILSAGMMMLPFAMQEQNLLLLVHRYAAFGALASGAVYTCLGLVAGKSDYAEEAVASKAPQAKTRPVLRS